MSGNNHLSVKDYFVWLGKHWFLAGCYSGIGLVIAFVYALSLTELYQAEIIFTIKSDAYNQGQVRRLDDFSTGLSTSATSEAVTYKPEVRFAMYVAGDDFAQRASAMLQQEFEGELKTDHPLAGNPAKWFYFFKRHFKYYRFERSEFHAVRWYFHTPRLLHAQLSAVMNLLDEQLQSELIKESRLQLDRLSELQRQYNENEALELFSLQEQIIQSRLALLTSDGYSLFVAITAIDVNQSPVLPNKPAVALAVFLFWMMLGSVVLQIFLLRTNSQDNQQEQAS